MLLIRLYILLVKSYQLNSEDKRCPPKCACHFDIGNFFVKLVENLA